MAAAMDSVQANDIGIDPKTGKFGENKVAIQSIPNTYTEVLECIFVWVLSPMDNLVRWLVLPVTILRNVRLRMAVSIAPLNTLQFRALQSR
jgi:hypothetical protein